MTEQITNQPKDRRTRAEIAANESFLKDQLRITQEAILNPTAEVVVEKQPKKAKRRFDKRTTQNTAAAVGVVSLVGLGVLAGAVLFGEHSEPNKTGSSASPTNTASIDGATPTPSRASASPSPEATATGSPTASTEASNSFTQKELKEGWTRTEVQLLDGSKIKADIFTLAPTKDVTVDAGTVVSGDVATDGKDQFDTDAQTGLIMNVQKNGTVVHGTWGATLLSDFDPSKTDALLQTLKAQALDNGCGIPGGCKEVVTTTLEADGTYHPYNASTQPTSTETPKPVYSFDGMTKDQEIKAILNLFSTGQVDPNSTEGKALWSLIAQCLCITPTATSEPTSSPKPTETPAPACVPGVDTEYQNTANGVISKAPHFTAKGGETWEIQGDVVVKKDGKFVKDFDNRSDTGAITWITLPVGEKVEVYMVYGGDAHKLNSCTTQDEANQLLSMYKQQVQDNGHPGGVTVYKIN